MLGDNMHLRDYQLTAIEKLRTTIAQGRRKVILHSPCGSGKTVIAASIIALARSKGNAVLFLANRRELIFQAKAILEQCGLTCGVIMAGEEPDLSNSLQIASMQTYVRRMALDEEGQNPWFHQAQLIIADECHSTLAPTWQKILQAYDTVTIGLTATPCRGDGRGLGEYYQDIVSTVDVGGLIEQGYLVPVRYFVPTVPDLARIKTVAGDYDKKELGHRMDQAKLVGDIVGNWLKICPDRQTIIFAVNVKHSVHIVESFLAVGIKAEHVDARTPAEERKEILDRLKNGDTQVVSNVGILTEGFDFPAAGCIVLARPTKSLGLYLQMAGRGLRPYPGKANVCLIDHGGCVAEHGLVEWPREWTLDGKKRAWSEPKKEVREKKLMQCRACNLVYVGGGNCPDCGTEPKHFGRKIKVVDANLMELKPGKGSVVDKRIFLGMLKAWVPRQKNPNPKRINGMFRGRYGVWPHSSYRDVAPIEPDLKFLAYVRYQQICWARRWAA